MNEITIIFEKDTMVYIDNVLSKHTINILITRKEDTYCRMIGTIELGDDGKYYCLTRDYVQRLSITNINMILEEMKSRALNYEYLKYLM